MLPSSGQVCLKESTCLPSRDLADPFLEETIASKRWVLLESLLQSFGGVAARRRREPQGADVRLSECPMKEGRRQFVRLRGQ